MSFNIKEKNLFFEETYICELDESENNKFNAHTFGCKNIGEIYEEINTSFLDELKLNDFLEDMTFSFFAEDLILKVGRKNSIVYLSITNSFLPFDWEEYYPYGKFVKEFEKYIFDDKRFVMESDDQMCHITSTLIMNENETFKSLKNRVKRFFKDKYVSFFKKNKIENTISFAPEHISAGSSILQYFGKLIQEKYPDEQVSVSIKQEGLKVTMIVDTTDGKKEEIEEYLNRYGMVVTNQITPQEFTSNPIQILELETKLAQAEQEIKFQKKLLALQDKTYDETLISIKDEVEYLRSELSSLRISNNENIQLLLTSLLKKDKLINKLSKSIEKRDDKKTKKLLLKLKDKDSKGYVGLKEHVDNIIVNNLSNAPAWIDFIHKVI